LVLLVFLASASSASANKPSAGANKPSASTNQPGASAHKPSASAERPTEPKPPATCVDEPALAEAAAELLLEGHAPSDEALATAVRRAGSDAVLVRALYTVSSSNDPRATEASRRAPYVRWLTEAQERADSPLACGAAQSERGQLFLLAPRAGTLAPLGSKRPIVRGTLADGFADPSLVVVDGSGASQRIELSRSELAKGVAIDPELPRPVRVQLVAKGPAGPRPLAERVLGTLDAIDHDALLPAPDLDPMSQLTLARGDAGHPGLRKHTLLTQVATAHAAQVCAAGRIAHELAKGADPEARLRAQGVAARRVGETIARDRTAQSAFARMLQSPAHHMTLLERTFTDVGIGEARDDRGRVCLVVLLAAWPRFVGR
jgi:hypothetical protein